ncbi:MAG: zf-HC2 domain-containing protein [Bryobacterales bacterium]|nr:zf-HC2 domain-containing protein [Bryobacterales bacterium]
MLNARCESEVDLIAYQLGEATAAERRAVEVHIRSCEECAGELARLGVTQAALLSVREEEPPRRIAFVSDKVFEPTWYQRLWQPMPAWALGAASLIAGAIVFHAMWAPGTVVAPTHMTQTPARRALPEAVNGTMMEARIKTMVQQAVADVEKRSEQRTRTLLAEAEKRHEMDRTEMLGVMNANYEELSKRYKNLLRYTASVDTSTQAVGQ